MREPGGFYLLKTQRLIGHCQLTYEFIDRGAERKRRIYCLQDQGQKHGGIRLMRCSLDGEPSHQVSMPSDCHFEVPIIDEQLDSEYTIELKRLCIEWIAANVNKG